MQHLDHKHIIVTAAVRTPPRTVEAVIDWQERLVAAVDMKVVIGPFAHYVDTPGNEGVTGVVCIETSHSSIHVWDEAEVPFIKFDLYSCKTFDPDVVLNLVREFDPYYFEWILLDRNFGIDEIARGAEQVISPISLLSNEDRTMYLEANRVKGRKHRTPEMKAARSKYAKILRLYSLAGVNHKKRYKHSHRATLACIKSRANKRGFEFDLTQEWYDQELVTAKHKYSKLNVHTSQEFWSADVDRIDSNAGYTQDNCRIIPHGLNVAKWDWTKDQLRDLLPMLIELLLPFQAPYRW